MPQYRVMLGLGVTPLGSTETYITPTVSGSAAQSLVQQLLDKRVAFLRQEIVVAGVRISDTAVKRSSQLLLPGQVQWPDKTIPGGLNIPTKGQYAFTGDTYKGIPFNNALQLRVGYGGNGRFTNKYLAGVVCGVADLEPGNLNLGGAGTFKTAVLAFIDFLQTNQFYVRARDQSGVYAPVQVQQLVQATLGISQISLVVPSGVLGAIAVGEYVTLSGFRNKKTAPAASFNGKWRVTNVNTTYTATQWAIDLEGTETIDARQFKKLGTVQRINYTLQLITTVTPQRIAEHRRGKPFTSPPGRRKTRLSLDP